MRLFGFAFAVAWVVPTALSGATFPGPVGEWRVADGTATVAIHACGADLCGFIASARDGDPIIGRQIFLGLKKSGNGWAGIIVNARDGQKYRARISLHNERTLKVEGCIIGGLICGGQHWSRLK
jgi:uncharacterized protein (DUF2147 family)